MTESEWLSSSDPLAMLEFVLTHGNPRLGAAGSFRPSDRKLRPFMCAIWRSRQRHLKEGFLEAIAAIEDGTWDGQPNGWQVAEPASLLVGNLRRAMVGINTSRTKHGEDGATFAEQASILRDIVGNPFQSITLPSVCLNCGSTSQEPEVDYACCGRCGRTKFGCPWLTPTVASLARAACEERVEQGHLDPVRLAILADALLDAGCDDEAILRHLRPVPCVWCHGSGVAPWHTTSTGTSAEPVPCSLCSATGQSPVQPVHVRGCWAIDCILGGPREVSLPVTMTETRG